MKNKFEIAYLFLVAVAIITIYYPNTNLLQLQAILVFILMLWAILKIIGDNNE